jgi:large-conductance mechanosensitive channel
MSLRRIVGFLVLALVIFFVITEPESAADSVRSILGTLRNAADSITTFFTELV